MATGLAAIVAAAVFRGSLGYFFAQDDFAGLARARGVLPPLAGPWRWISGQLYFDVMRAVAGDHAAAYHLTSLAVHTAVSAALAWALARRLAAPAALAGAAFFAAHPSHYTALYSISGIGELLAALFALLAVAAWAGAGGARWLAPAAFALSLLCKENTLLLPAGLLVARASGARVPRDERRLLAVPDRAADGGTPVARAAGDRARRARGGLDPVLAAMFGVAALGTAMLAMGDAFGVRRGLAEGSAYRLGFGRNLIENALTYAGWMAHVAVPFVRGYTDAVDPPAMPWGVALLAAWIGGLFVPAWRDRGWAAAGILAALLIAPVLPLRHHTYHYYLYAPLLAVAWGVAIAADAAIEALGRGRAPRAGRGAATAHAAPAARRGAGAARGADASRGRGPGAHAPSGSAPDAAWFPTPAPVAAAALVFAWLVAVNGGRLVRRIETAPFGATTQRADPTVDRMIIARNLRDGLAAANLPAGASLALWSPRVFQPGLDTEARRDTTRDTYWERNVRSALMDGLAVRVLLPNVARVRFVRAYQPGAGSADEWWGVYRTDGFVQVASTRQLDSLLAERPEIR